MRNLSKKAKTIIAGAAIAGLASTGVAYAYWTTTGGGTGSASTTGGSAAAFTVAGGVPNAMFPGDSVQTITATVTNTGTENNKVLSLTAWVSTNKPGCDGSDFLINGAPAPSTALTAVDLSIVPVDLIPTGTTTKTYTIQFNNKPTVQDVCKSAAVTVHYIAG